MNRLLLLSAAGVGGWLLWKALRPRYSFRDRHVLITGGSRGLGLVLARQLVKAGAQVSICSRDAAELSRAEDDLTSRGGQVFASECDVTDPEQVRRWVGECRRRLGPVDVLVNNAGVIRVGPAGEMRADDYELSLRTHFWATFHTTSVVVPEMTARRQGRIVNVTSVGGKIAVPHLLPYAVGKFAQVGYSTGLRAELAKHGIVVTTVCPGLMRTGSHLHAEFKGKHDDEYAWFAAGNGNPLLSMSAESAAAQILDACATGEGEVVLSLPAKLAVAVNAVAPNLMAGLNALVNRWVLPEQGGIGPAVMDGAGSRGKVPDWVTSLSDRAAERNNELPAPQGSRP